MVLCQLCCEGCRYHYLQAISVRHVDILPELRIFVFSSSTQANNELFNDMCCCHTRPLQYKCSLFRQKDVFMARSTEALLYSDVLNTQLSGWSGFCTGRTSFSGSAFHSRLFMLPIRIHVCRCHRLCSVFKIDIPFDDILHLFVKRLEGIPE